MPTLVLQMGHSGRTSGATGAPGEMAFTEAVGAACVRLLGDRSGWTVRAIAADVSGPSYRGDVFVAVHADGSTNPSVRGASVGYQNPLGRALAHAWRDAYVRRGFTGPWRPDNYTTNLARYYGVTNAISQGNEAACIIECGTITNAEDRALMSPDRVALAIGDALGIHQEEDVVTGPVDLNPHQQVLLEPSQLMILQDNIARTTALLSMVVSGPELGDHDPQDNILAETLIRIESKLDTLIALFGEGVVLRGTGEIVVRAEQP